MAGTEGTDKQEDHFDLARFTAAQETVYATALSELRDGRKRTHWMWYIFPQIAGLGYSATSKRYALRSLDEAQEYLAHPVLGPRLRECAEAVLPIQGRSASAIFGSPDDVKFQSSLTLFGCVPGADPVFTRLLEKFFRGEQDGETLRRLEASSL